MRFAILSVLLAALSLPATVLAEGDIEVGKIKAYTCTGCHGIPGYKNTYPMYKVPLIGGQNAAYVSAALAAYQSGQRVHPTMMLQAESLSEEDIADITAWVSSFDTSPPALVDSSLSTPEKVQLCQTCHGEDGMGTDPSYPVLAGQHESYLSRALHDYRSGARTNAVMGGFASSLTDGDIKELAKWYAGMHGLKDLSQP